MPDRGSSSVTAGVSTSAKMNESIPSSAQPPQAAQKPRIWLGVRGGAAVVEMCVGSCKSAPLVKAHQYSCSAWLVSYSVAPRLRSSLAVRSRSSAVRNPYTT